MNTPKEYLAGVQAEGRTLSTLMRTTSVFTAEEGRMRRSKQADDKVSRQAGSTAPLQLRLNFRVASPARAGQRASEH